MVDLGRLVRLRVLGRHVYRAWFDLPGTVRPARLGRPPRAGRTSARLGPTSPGSQNSGAWSDRRDWSDLRAWSSLPGLVRPPSTWFEPPAAWSTSQVLESRPQGLVRLPGCPGLARLGPPPRVWWSLPGRQGLPQSDILGLVELARLGSTSRGGRSPGSGASPGFVGPPRAWSDLRAWWSLHAAWSEPPIEWSLRRAWSASAGAWSELRAWSDLGEVVSLTCLVRPHGLLDTPAWSARGFVGLPDWSRPTTAWSSLFPGWSGLRLGPASSGLGSLPGSGPYRVWSGPSRISQASSSGAARFARPPAGRPPFGGATRAWSTSRLGDLRVGQTSPTWSDLRGFGQLRLVEPPVLVGLIGLVRPPFCPIRPPLGRKLAEEWYVAGHGKLLEGCSKLSEAVGSWRIAVGEMAARPVGRCGRSSSKLWGGIECQVVGSSWRAIGVVGRRKLLESRKLAGRKLGGSRKLSGKVAGRRKLWEGRRRSWEAGRKLGRLGSCWAGGSYGREEVVRAVEVVGAVGECLGVGKLWEAVGSCGRPGRKMSERRSCGRLRSCRRSSRKLWEAVGSCWRDVGGAWEGVEAVGSCWRDVGGALGGGSKLEEGHRNLSGGHRSWPGVVGSCGAGRKLAEVGSCPVR
ncbi:hypothetical protein FNV43_RR09541 [Rhamnella rubrinervis]|uniref:Uncharacterized protein n=1 Tax=Rhamnella rubrinervis TaxID=2594499 RepID=A0A8K0HBI2_9ROSA|nr:hypothetical protein FNV43_RR09541 [Rhamnella rubrinervis]